MIKSPVAPVLLIALFGLPPTPARAEDDVPLVSERQAKSSSNAVVVTGATGIGSFQDIQVPMNPTTKSRADGSTAATENTQHVGIPMIIDVGYDKRLSGGWTWRVLNANGLMMQATSGSQQTANASYTRLALGTSATYASKLGDDYRCTAGFGLEARRSTFSNVSTSHYVDSALISGHAGLNSGALGLDLAAGYAPVARLGFTDDGYFSGHDFAQSSTTVTEIGANLTYKLRPGVWLEAGYSDEMIHMMIPDVAEYSSFGLVVDSQDHSSRSYSMATTVAHIGFRKAF